MRSSAGATISAPIKGPGSQASVNIFSSLRCSILCERSSTRSPTPLWARLLRARVNAGSHESMPTTRSAGQKRAASIASQPTPVRLCVPRRCADHCKWNQRSKIHIDSYLRRTCGLDHWRVIGGTCLRLIFFVGHNFTVSLYPFFEFSTDIVGRLLRHAASFKKQDQECQTDCANIGQPRHTKESDIFLQSLMLLFFISSRRRVITPSSRRSKQCDVGSSCAAKMEQTAL